MTLNELIENLTKLRDMPIGNGDIPVCIRVTRCLSSNTSVNIRSMNIGIDWESGRVMLTPEQDLERYYTPEEINKREQDFADMMKISKAQRNKK